MRIGFACAYTPLALIDAAGCEPYRILPLTAAPDQAGQLLHDNLCPHVKRVLDRALADDLPELLGTVLVNSCDAMRRLADALRQARPHQRLLLIDLPVSPSEPAQRWFHGELETMRETLAEWSGHQITDAAIAEAIDRHNLLTSGLATLRERLQRGTLPGGSPAMQQLVNQISTQPMADSLITVKAMVDQPEGSQHAEGVPVLLFGNVLPEPEAFELFERSGARIVADDLCTGSRLLQPIADQDDDLLLALARSTLSRPPCARTFTTKEPGKLGADIVARAQDSGAQAVIAHVVKFCDPYLGRMPAVRQACEQAGLPLLVLEGDCTMRSVGQHATRIEAFVEMMG